MKLKTRVRIAGAITVCVIVICGALTLYSDLAMENLTQDAKKADAVVNKIAILRSLTQDYLLYRTERAQRQWWAVYDEARQLLNNREHRKFQRRYGIGDTPDKLKIIGDTFSRLLKIREIPGPDNTAGELHNRLATQLLLTTQDLVTRFINLNGKINERLTATQRLSYGLDFLTLFTLSLLLVSTAVFLQRSVVHPILKLHEGVEIIGGGNLDHKVGLTTPDEIGELSRAFDRMTTNLQQVTVSRNLLAREVEVRQQAENALKEKGEERDLAIKILGLVNAPTSLRELAHEVTKLLQEWSGCEAVGLRLRQGEDFPYFETRGFPAEFVKLENSLCAKDRSGELLRDNAGNPVIECMCGNVICSRFNPELPFFTPRGSFWTNSTTQLLASTTDKDRQAHTRNRCHGEGYESVALVPLRSGQESLGLLQFNDRNQGKFTREKIGLFEQLGDNLASGIARRLAEEEVRRLASFPQINPSPVLEVDLSGAITFYNQAALEALEKLGPQAELRELIPKDLGKILATIRKKQERLFYREVEIKDTVFSQNIFYVEAFEVLRIYSMDITQRQQAEEELRRLNLRLALLAETAGQLLSSVSPQQVVNSLCLKVCTVLDCDAFFNFLVDEPSGRLRLNAVSGIPEEEARRIEWLDYGMAVCGCAARDGCRIVAEDIRNTPDPRTDLVKSYGIQAYACHPLMVEGRVLGTLSFGTRKRSSFTGDELALMKAVADHVAIAMNRQQAEENLKRTLADLERSNRELEEFAFISSHDMQEPLRQIANFSEILGKEYRERLDERAVRYFGFVTDGAKRMQTLINDLLSYSRVDQAEIPQVPTSLETVLQGTLHDLNSLIQGTAAEISHDPLPTLRVNPSQMGQLLQNLIGNAIKFRNEQPPRIHLSARQEDGEWLISVQDNGIGFNHQYAERIFKLFKRMHSEEKYPGTGIGLAICKKIVERHGGRIWAESKPGRGATFYFTIPV